jgi:hypothetical protein
MRALFQPPTDDHAMSALQAFGWHALTGTNDVAADGGLCANRPVVPKRGGCWGRKRAVDGRALVRASRCRSAVRTGLDQVRKAAVNAIVFP